MWRFDLRGGNSEALAPNKISCEWSEVKSSKSEESDRTTCSVWAWKKPKTSPQHFSNAKNYPSSWRQS